MNEKTACLMGKLAALRAARGIEKSAETNKEAALGLGLGVLLTLLAEAGIFGGKKLYDYATAPDPQRGLSPHAKKYLEGANVDTRWFDPIKLPENITAHDKELMKVYGFTPQSIAYHKRMMVMKKEQEAEATKKKEEATAEAAKPVGLSDYFKSRPQIRYLLSQMPQQQQQQQQARRASPRMPPPTRAHEAGFWKKYTGGTPGRMRAERDAFRTGNARRQGTEDYISRVNELFGQGGRRA